MEEQEWLFLPYLLFPSLHSDNYDIYPVLPVAGQTRLHPYRQHSPVSEYPQEYQYSAADVFRSDTATSRYIPQKQICLFFYLLG